MGVSKNRGRPPKMDGENNGSKPYEQMDDLGGFPPMFGGPPRSLLCEKGRSTIPQLPQPAQPVEAPSGHGHSYTDLAAIATTDSG